MHTILQEVSQFLEPLSPVVSRRPECETYVAPIQYLDNYMLIPELASYRRHCCRCVLLRPKSEEPWFDAERLELWKGSLSC